MKKKALEDKKKKLDEQVAAALAAKKAKLQKKAPPAPSESEIYLGVFTAKHGNLLEKIFTASGSHGTGFFEDEVEQVETVAENVGGASAGGDEGGGGVDTEVESSEATPRYTIYTRCPPGSGGCGTSGVPRNSEYEQVHSGSWDTHNPTCADLLHAPRWNLTHGSRMTDLNNCREFFSMSPPRPKDCFKRNIAREWQLMGEDTLEFEAAKKAFAEEREKFNAEKWLSWRVANAEDKLAKEKRLNADKEKEWETACEWTNREMQTQRDAIIRLSGEKTKISEDAEQERVA
ncbi:hypothetical protein Hanom_Chr03g00252191 [Helianthus anomalus]